MTITLTDSRVTRQQHVPVAAATIAAVLAASALGQDRGAAAAPRAFVPEAAALDSRSLAAESAAIERDRDDPEADAARERRTYVTGMVGSTLGTAATGGVATAAAPGGSGVSGQAAVGVEIPRRVGTWRVEFEGRRFSAAGAASPAASPAGAGQSATDVTWSTTASAWRELPLVGDLSGYAGGGGGFGAAGSRVGPAWQAGAGLAWAVTERVTFDVGYRLHGPPPAAGSASTAEGEVLFAVRVFEPLRGWRR